MTHAKSKSEFRESADELAARIAVLEAQLAQSTEQLAKSERRFRDIMESFADWYWESGPDHGFTFVGGPIEQHTRRSAASYYGIKRWEVPGNVEPADAPFWRAHKATLDAHEAFRDFRFACRMADGELRHFSIDGKPVFDDEGRFLGYAGVGRDVSHLVALENRIADSERQFRDLAEGSKQAIIIHIHNKPVFANAKAAEMFGYDSAEDLLNLTTIHELFWPEEIDRVETYRKARIHGRPAPTDYDLRGRRKDGSMIWMDNRVWMVEWEGKPAIQATFSDITGRKRDQEVLKKSLSDLSEAQRIGHVGSWEHDFGATPPTWSDETYRILGYRPHSITLSPDNREYLNRIHPDDRAGVRAQVKQAMSEGRPYSVEYRIVHTDGAIRHVRENGEVTRDADGRARLIGTVLDTTELKQVEEKMRQARDEAERASRAKSRFLATMSHELRTPLNAIIGFSEVMQRHTFGPLGSQRYEEYVADIGRSGTHLLSLINDLLDISTIEAGKHRLDRQAVRLDELLRECIRDTSPSAQRGRVTLSSDVASELPTLMADPRSVRQIVLNILSNAIKFTPADGRVHVTVSKHKDDIVVTVADTGIGIPAEKLATVTEPFERSFGNALVSQEGTGLGLSIAKRLIEAHGGAMDIDSKVGVGTTVRIRLPVDG